MSVPKKPRGRSRRSAHRDPRRGAHTAEAYPPAHPRAQMGTERGTGSHTRGENKIHMSRDTGTRGARPTAMDTPPPPGIQTQRHPEREARGWGTDWATHRDIARRAHTWTQTRSDAGQPHPGGDMKAGTRLHTRTTFFSVKER